MTDASQAITETVRELRGRGVRLWAEGGRLRYSAPRGILSAHDLRKLGDSRSEILSLIGSSVATQHPALDRHQPPEPRTPAPLSYSQTTHWNTYDLGRRPAIRQIASATRLRGNLIPTLLEAALDAVISHHEGLRTRIRYCDGVPMQEVLDSSTCQLQLEDLSGTPAHRLEQEVALTIRRCILEPIDIGRDSLLGARLLKISNEDNVLVIALEHLISDAVSMGILLQDLFQAYHQARNQQQISLAPVDFTFAEFATLQSRAEESWVLEHAGYWREKLDACGFVRCPADSDLGFRGEEGWGSVPFAIDGALKSKLTEIACKSRATLPVLVLSTFAAQIMDWCKTSTTIIQFLIDGRLRPKHSNVIGYFACPLYLRVSLRGTDNILSLTKRTMQEHCSAYEHVDHSYLQTRLPRPDFTRCSFLNWIPHGRNFDRFSRRIPDSGLRRTEVPFSHPLLDELQMDNDPGLVVYEEDDQLLFSLNYPRLRFSENTMQCLRRRLINALESAVRDPNAPYLAAG